MKVIFVTADNIQSAPRDVPGDFHRHHRTVFLLFGPTLTRLDDYHGLPMLETAARRYDLDHFDYILIDGHRETAAIYRELR